MDPQKLLAACSLPSFLPVVGLIASQVQCTLFITWCPASLWQARQALVTSGPVLNGPCSSLNLL
jgi:hypothetical protein